MRTFVSLIVWLFCVTGLAVNGLTITPENYVLVKGSGALLHCASTGKYVDWTYQPYKDPSEDGPVADAVSSDCFPVAPFLDAHVQRLDTGGASCTLIARGTIEQLTLKYICSEGDHWAYAIVLFLESPLTCGIEDNKYSCTMANSAYKNESAITDTPYIVSRLIWSDSDGKVVSTQDSDFQTPGTVVTAAIPDGISKDKPYVCSAEFNIAGNFGFRNQYSSSLNMMPDEKLECKYPLTDTHVEEAHVAAVMAAVEESVAKEAAKEAERKVNKTSNANLERDGVDAIAMLLSLMAAFLVY